ncbi:MAG: doxx family protein [Cyclobacteriaceae bacterium]
MILKLREWDEQLIEWLRVNVFMMIRISTGLIYLVFGGLKFLPNYSPAETLAAETIGLITFDLFSGSLALYALAVIETIIGVGLILNFKVKWTIRIALWHMACTFFPMILLPGAAYTDAPYSLSLVGQYILKNLVVVSALLAVYCHTPAKQSLV